MRTENKQALETKKCPRCRDGKVPLHFRHVLDDRGSTSPDFFELYCISGHSFNFSVKEVRAQKISDKVPMWEVRNAA